MRNCGVAGGRPNRLLRNYGHRQLKNLAKHAASAKSQTKGKISFYGLRKEDIKARITQDEGIF